VKSSCLEGIDNLRRHIRPGETLAANLICFLKGGGKEGRRSEKGGSDIRTQLNQSKGRIKIGAASLIGDGKGKRAARTKSTSGEEGGGGEGKGGRKRIICGLGGHPSGRRKEITHFSLLGGLREGDEVTLFSVTRGYLPQRGIGRGKKR